MGSYIILEHLGRAAILTLNQPPANLLTIEALEQLALQVHVLQQDPAVRAVVLTGAGDSFFSAGASLAPFEHGDHALAQRAVDALQAAFAAIRSFDGVTVAAINGYALGAGLECALSCDYIVAERGARLGMTQARVGLLPAGGGAKLLADKVGQAWAKRMVLGGEVLDADVACRIGLVEEVVDPGFAKIIAVSLANKVSQQGPQAVQAAQRLIEDSRGMSLETHLCETRAAFLQLIGGEEQLVGVAAFLEKHAPPWSDDEDDEDDF
jgi:enoyl-CoA hydratase/carnithine racemase